MKSVRELWGVSDYAIRDFLGGVISIIGYIVLFKRKTIIYNRYVMQSDLDTYSFEKYIVIFIFIIGAMLVMRGQCRK